MVLGGPGIGKSTFLRKLGIEALKGEAGQLTHRRIPVLLELKEMRDPKIDLVGAIAKEFAVCGFPAAAAFTQKTLEQGKLLVLLDGLDEVPKQNLNRVIEAIEDFVDQYDKNCFVASCRIAAYNSSFRRFTDVTIAEFDDEQIEQSIRRWFQSELDQRNQTAGKYWELLSKPEHSAPKELAHTPLLLTFLCLVYDREQTLPSTHSALYGDALNILLKEWAAQKRLERDPIYDGFHPDLEKMLLAQIAYDTFEQDKLFFSKAEITAQIAKFLTYMLNAPKHLDASIVLKAIEVQQGLIVERATDTYSFSHLTIQEYLAAHHIVERGRVENLTDYHMMDERWHAVFLIVSGLLGIRSGDLLLNIENVARDTLKNVEIEQTLIYINRTARQLDLNVEEFLKRILVAFWMFDFDSPIILDTIQRLDLRLYRELIDYTSAGSPQKNSGLAKALKKVLAERDAKMLLSSNTKKSVLIEYFKAINIMIKCKESAVFVSREIWRDITNKILEVEDLLEFRMKNIASNFLSTIEAKISNEKYRTFNIIDMPNGSLISPPISVVLVYNQTLEEGVKSLKASQGSLRKTPLTVIIFYQNKPTSKDRETIYKARFNDNLILIPIPIDEVENASSDRHKCYSVLDSYVKRYAKPSDFFDDRQSIDDRLLFFGRGRLLSSIIEDLSRHQGIGLFGIRKSGKTSVLKQIALLTKQRPVIQIDLQGYMGPRYGARLFNEILRQLHFYVDFTDLEKNLNALGEYPNIETFSNDLPAKEIASEFVSKFEKASKYLMGCGYEFPAFLLLDEMETIIPVEADSRDRVEEFNACLSAFRVLSQSHQLLSLMVADVHPDCNRINQWPHYGIKTNPVFSFFKEITLSPFSEDETLEMLTDLGKFMNIKVNENIAKQIHFQSGGNPYISRQIAHFLYENSYMTSLDSSSTFEQDAWEDMLIDFAELSSYFRESIWKDLEKRGQYLVLDIFRIISANCHSCGYALNEDSLIFRLKNRYSTLEIRQSLAWLDCIGFIELNKNDAQRPIEPKALLFFCWIRISMDKKSLEKWKI